MQLTLTDSMLHLQPITANDMEMLYTIYASTRTEELKLTDWTEIQKEAFMRSQFSAQHIYYQNNYVGAHFLMIIREAEVIGRLYLHCDYEKDSIRIIDISILPLWRNKGIGEQLLLDIIAFAEIREQAVSIHVESFNPAMKLYKKLGFKLIDVTNEVYHLLEWNSKKLILQ